MAPANLVLLLGLINVLTSLCYGTDPSLCDCGWRQQIQARIIGGEDTDINEFAFMAGLENTRNGQIYCGASIISKRYVLTTAKCCKDRPAGEAVLVVGNAGDTKVTKRYKIKEFIVHEKALGFNKNNIALIRTAEDIRFSMAVGPICLPSSYVNKSFEALTVTTLGWGLLNEYPKEEATELQKVDLIVSDQEQCHEQYYADPSKYMCTYAKLKGPCRKDNGGPVVWFDDVNTYRNFLVGVMSNGTCGSEKPDLVMRITSYLPWIQDKTSDVPACYK